MTKFENYEEKILRPLREQPGSSPRSKPTWRDKDNAKDKKGHQSESKSSRGRPIEKTPTYRAYQSQLNRLFEGGIQLNPALQKVVSDAKQASAVVESRSWVDQLKQADTEEQISTCLRAALAANEPFPRDCEALAQVLRLSDEALLIQAVETLLDAMERRRPPNAKILCERLQLSKAHIKDSYILELIVGLCKRLA